MLPGESVLFSTNECVFRKIESTLLLSSFRLVICPKTGDVSQASVYPLTSMVAHKLNKAGSERALVKLILASIGPTGVNDEIVIELTGVDRYKLQVHLSKLLTDNLGSHAETKMVASQQEVERLSRVKKLALTKESALADEYESLVEQGLVSPEEFWTRHSARLVEAEKEVQASDKGSLIGGQVGGLGSHIAPSPIDSTRVVAGRTADSLFGQFPQLRPLFDKLVPAVLSEGTFWSKFLSSNYFRLSQGSDVDVSRSSGDDIIDGAAALGSDLRGRKPDRFVEIVPSSIDLASEIYDKSGSAQSTDQLPGGIAESRILDGFSALSRRINDYSSLIVDEKSHTLDPDVNSISLESLLRARVDVNERDTIRRSQADSDLDSVTGLFTRDGFAGVGTSEFDTDAGFEAGGQLHETFASPTASNFTQYTSLWRSSDQSTVSFVDISVVKMNTIGLHDSAELKNNSARGRQRDPQLVEVDDLIAQATSGPRGGLCELVKRFRETLSYIWKEVSSVKQESSSEARAKSMAPLMANLRRLKEEFEAMARDCGSSLPELDWAALGDSLDRCMTSASLLVK